MSSVRTISPQHSDASYNTEEEKKGVSRYEMTVEGEMYLIGIGYALMGNKRTNDDCCFLSAFFLPQIFYLTVRIGMMRCLPLFGLFSLTIPHFPSVSLHRSHPLTLTLTQRQTHTERPTPCHPLALPAVLFLAHTQSSQLHCLLFHMVATGSQRADLVRVSFLTCCAG